MRDLRAALLGAIFFIGLATSAVLAGEPITIRSLLEEMTARETLARLPEPAYTCSQASSYDRRSVDPEDHTTWFANGDRSQWVRTEEREVDGKTRKEWVMMDQAGPGAIVRFWATWHGPRGGKFSNGTLRVYLDGSDTPAIEGPIQDVIDQGLLCEGPLSQGVSPETHYDRRGHNLYLPIPYAKHCKVTYSTDVPMDVGARRGEALYYQLNYRTYEAGTEVDSFSMEKLAAAKGAIDTAQKQLIDGVEIDCDSLSEDHSQTELAAGDNTTVELSGSKAVRLMSLKMEAEDMPQALRSTVLKIEFDGEPAVWVPVGEFFGVGYKSSEYKSFYTQMQSDGTMIAKWVMPFEKSAKLTLENLGDQKVVVDLTTVHTPWKWDDHSMHFHAAWHELHHAETFVEGRKRGEHAYDVNYVTAKGQGVYVGDTLTIFNGSANWWGEGDEKIYVDGESFPSHFGTGTEDYYGYAWCLPANFHAPFHAQPCGDGNLVGGFSVNSRYRALDAIPFNKSLKFDMELWHWSETKVNYAPTVFFYARPGATHNIAPDPEAAARAVTRSRGELGTIHMVDGAMEGEDLMVARRTGGSTSVQTSGAWGWSNEKQLWWQNGKDGDELIIEFHTLKPGRYQVIANLTKAPDYAKVKLSVNGETTHESLDCYGPGVNSEEVVLGEFDLALKRNRLGVQIVGHNEEALKRGMFGLDYLKLNPVIPEAP